MTLQNTLIMVNLGKEGGDMLALTAVSSALFLAAIIAVSIANLANRRAATGRVSFSGMGGAGLKRIKRGFGKWGGRRR